MLRRAVQQKFTNVSERVLLPGKELKKSAGTYADASMNVIKKQTSPEAESPQASCTDE
jgi:hypothetical protein